MMMPCRLPVALAALAALVLPTLAGAQQTPADDTFGAAAMLLTQLVFLLVPVSVGLQVLALRKLEGRLLQAARMSACAMAALWLFVIVTGIAGSNISPLWLVASSPLFVLFLGVLLVMRSWSGADEESPLVPPRG